MYDSSSIFMGFFVAVNGFVRSVGLDSDNQTARIRAMPKFRAVEAAEKALGQAVGRGR